MAAPWGFRGSGQMRWAAPGSLAIQFWHTSGPVARGFWQISGPSCQLGLVIVLPCGCVLGGQFHVGADSFGLHAVEVCREVDGLSFGYLTFCDPSAGKFDCLKELRICDIREVKLLFHSAIPCGDGGQNVCPSWLSWRGHGHTWTQGLSGLEGPHLPSRAVSIVACVLCPSPIYTVWWTHGHNSGLDTRFSGVRRAIRLPSRGGEFCPRRGPQLLGPNPPA